MQQVECKVVASDNDYHNPAIIPTLQIQQQKLLNLALHRVVKIIK